MMLRPSEMGVNTAASYFSKGQGFEIPDFPDFAKESASIVISYTLPECETVGELRARQKTGSRVPLSCHVTLEQIPVDGRGVRV
jgi:hypothetical protein